MLRLQVARDAVQVTFTEYVPDEKKRKSSGSSLGRTDLMLAGWKDSTAPEIGGNTCIGPVAYFGKPALSQNALSNATF